MKRLIAVSLLGASFLLAQDATIYTLSPEEAKHGSDLYDRLQIAQLFYNAWKTKMEKKLTNPDYPRALKFSSDFKNAVPDSTTSVSSCTSGNGLIWSNGCVYLTGSGIATSNVTTLTGVSDIGSTGKLPFPSRFTYDTTSGSIAGTTLEVKH